MKDINKIEVVDTYDSNLEAKQAAKLFDDRVNALINSGKYLDLEISGDWEIEALVDGYKLTTVINVQG